MASTHQLTNRLAAYGWVGLRRDLIAGLTVATVAVPQAMAYALIAGVDPRYALYTAVVMTALASILGSSSHLINGPTNAVIVVEACTNLSHPVWLPVATNTFSGSGTSTFSDSSGYPSRYYRFRSP